ncbi:MAG: amidohydrolase family protein [Phycisphaerales bacterium]|jgi:imidazolonepropionase-like amidohydrolase
MNVSSRVFSVVGLIALAASGGAIAQDLTPRLPAPAGAVAIVNARIVPVSREPIDRGWVIMDQGKIASMGAGDLPSDPRRSVIDAKGLTLYPGLISAYTQMGLTEMGAVRATRDFNEVGDVTPEVFAAVSVNPDSWLMPVARSNGVLAFGVFPQGGVIAGRVSVTHADGWTWEDMTVRRDAGMVVSWPFMRVVRAWWMDQSEEEQLKRIRQGQERVEKAFETARAYIARKDAEPMTPTDIRWEAMRSVLGTAEKPAENPVFIEAQDVDQILAALAWSRKAGVRVVIVGGRDAPLCLEQIKDARAGVIFNSPLTMPKRDDSPVTEGFDAPRLLVEAGVPVAIASGEETPHERNLPYAAAICVAHGMKREDAVRAITLAPAQLLGVQDRLGSIEPGKDATLILTDGDVLEVKTRTVRAFIAGREVDLSNKQTILAERYREKYRQQNEQKSRQAPGAAPAR